MNHDQHKLNLGKQEDEIVVINRTTNHLHPSHPFFPEQIFLIIRPECC